MNLSRRNLIGSLLAIPAIVTYDHLMPVKSNNSWLEEISFRPEFAFYMERLNPPERKIDSNGDAFEAHFTIHRTRFLILAEKINWQKDYFQSSSGLWYKKAGIAQG